LSEPSRRGAVPPLSAQKSSAARSAATLSGAVALLFALACGSAVANVYYAQPLLDTMADEFGISHAVVGLIITITQIGYCIRMLASTACSVWWVQDMCLAYPRRSDRRTLR
jgi:hypothetical protein